MRAWCRCIGIGLWRALRWCGGLIAAPARRLDLRDVLIFGGMGLIGRGLWEIRPWLAYVVVGCMMFWLGVLLSRPAPGQYRWEKKKE